jgi:gamma-glutamyltranspeptidase
MLLNGHAPLPGQVVKLPYLARTFRELAEKGKDGFYKGRIAEAIVEVIQSKGGAMELEDLAKHKTDFVEPIHYTYAGELKVFEVSILNDSCTLANSQQVSSEWSRFVESRRIKAALIALA